ncbi:MAG: aminoacyl-histidine dipeptidase, partial [Kiritimatiellaeota bacterium]|nr:aminoacyl-histidine dipeptidase [Kiritimatiellota bacterium]
MKNDLSKLEPAALWGHFAAICAIPHASGNETALSAYIERFCDGKGISHERDSAGNLLLRKNASSAKLAGAPKIILQAHLDMVPQVNADSKHDFSSDPIVPILDDGWVLANGTTLGADNGIGIAAILAIMESGDIEHRPLAAILTVEEETGLRGATSLEPGFADGDILINLDSEDIEELYVACAGGRETTFVMDVAPERAPSEGRTFCEIAVAGLEGGHSGVDIHLGRANAVVLLFSVLAELADSVEIRLAGFTGGSLSNAIPREASAKLAVSGMNFEEISKLVADCRKKAETEYPDPDLRISTAAVPPLSETLSQVARERIISALSKCPNGVRRMSDELPGIVETSSNIGVAEMAGARVSVVTMQRSLVESEMNTFA